MTEWKQSASQENSRTNPLCGVTQGSASGPVLFILWAAHVIAVAERHGFRVHSYADDTQPYFHNKAGACKSRIPRFSNCISDIEIWMTSNHINMSTDKTDFIWLGTRQQLANVTCQVIDMGAVQRRVSKEVTCLGIVVDHALTFSSHVNCWSPSAFIVYFR